MLFLLHDVSDCQLVCFTATQALSEASFTITFRFCLIGLWLAFCTQLCWSMVIPGLLIKPLLTFSRLISVLFWRMHLVLFSCSLILQWSTARCFTVGHMFMFSGLPFIAAVAFSAEFVPCNSELRKWVKSTAWVNRSEGYQKANCCNTSCWSQAITGSFSSLLWMFGQKWLLEDSFNSLL